MNRFQRAGRKGGKTTAKKFKGTDHHATIGERGGLMCRTLYGSGLYSSIRTGQKKAN